MGPVAAIVKRWLEEDLSRPCKQRHTAKRIWERLLAEYGFKGGQSTVRQWVREHRSTNMRRLTLPLAHDPGAEALCGKPHRASYVAPANMRRRAWWRACSCWSRGPGRVVESA